MQPARFLLRNQRGAVLFPLLKEKVLSPRSSQEWPDPAAERPHSFRHAGSPPAWL